MPCASSGAKSSGSGGPPLASPAEPACGTLVDSKGAVMNVIIVVDSKHGSTRAIAEAIGDELRNGGLDVSIADADAAAVSSATTPQ